MKKTINLTIATWKKLRDIQTEITKGKTADFEEVIAHLISKYNQTKKEVTK